MEDNAKCAKLLLRNNLRGIKQNASAHLTRLRAKKKEAKASRVLACSLSSSLPLSLSHCLLPRRGVLQLFSIKVVDVKVID